MPKLEAVQQTAAVILGGMARGIALGDAPKAANLGVTGLKSTLPAEMVPNSIAASYWALNGRSFLRDRERLLVTA